MSHRVKIAPGLHRITLPDGNEYEGDDEVVLTDEQFARIASSALGDEVIDLGAEAEGPILKSPNGTKYRIIVANGGVLSTEVVA